MKGLILSAFFACLVAYSDGAGESCTKHEDCSITVERCLGYPKTCKVTLGETCGIDRECGTNQQCGLNSRKCETSIGKTCRMHIYCSIDQACDGRQCVAQCKSDADCGDGEKCLVGQGKLYCKAPCQRDRDCREETERCMLVDGKKYCRVPCQRKSHCTAREICLTGGGYCEAMTPPTPVCQGCCPANCNKNYCNSRGRYSVTNGEESCKCDTGYTGNKCENVPGVESSASSVEMSVTMCLMVLTAAITAL